MGRWFRLLLVSLGRWGRCLRSRSPLLLVNCSLLLFLLYLLLLVNCFRLLFISFLLFNLCLLLLVIYKVVQHGILVLIVFERIILIHSTSVGFHFLFLWNHCVGKRNVPAQIDGNGQQYSQAHKQPQVIDMNGSRRLWSVPHIPVSIGLLASTV